MTDGSFGAVDGSVVRGGPVPVAIAGIQIELREFRIKIQRIGQGLGPAMDEQIVEFIDEAKSPVAFQGFEVVGTRRASVEAVAVLLKVSPARSHLLQNPIDAKMDPGRIGELGTVTGMMAIDQEVEGRRKKCGGDRR